MCKYLMFIHSPLEQFSIVDLAGSMLSNYSVYLALGTALPIVGASLLSMQRGPIVRSNPSALPLVLDFVTSIVRSQTGLAGERYLLISFSVMIALLGVNLLGLTPYGFTPSSHFSFSLFLSLTAIFTATGAQLFGQESKFPLSSLMVLPLGLQTVPCGLGAA